MSVQLSDEMMLYNQTNFLVFFSWLKFFQSHCPFLHIHESASISRCLLPLQSAVTAGRHRLSLKVMYARDKSGSICACAASFTAVDINTFLRKMSANERRRLFFLSFFFPSLNFAKVLEKRLQVQQFSFFSPSAPPSHRRMRGRKRAEEFIYGWGHWVWGDSKLLPASQEGVDWLADPSATSSGRKKGKKNTNVKIITCSRSKCSEAQKRSRAESQWAIHRATEEIRNIKPARKQINKKGIGAAALCVSFSVNIFY